MITLEQYAEKYGFSIPEVMLDDRPAKIADLRANIAAEQFKERKKVFQKLLKPLLREETENSIIQKISCNLINLPITYVSGLYRIADPSLFIGGIEKRLESVYLIKFPDLSQSSGVNWVRHPDTKWSRLYRGYLPAPVIEKYIEAKRFFPIKAIAVISKDLRLFDSKIVVAPFTSPLLVAFGQNNTQYLLACWGLEHDIEKRYGGLLEDTLKEE